MNPADQLRNKFHGCVRAHPVALTGAAASFTAATASPECQLKRVDMADYKVAFTSQQRARLSATFPKGVCEWSRTGVKQVKAVPFGPSPENLVFDVTDRRRQDDDDDD